jgi:prepilin-type N-terminal cleavage/methylation domain-containing protein
MNEKGFSLIELIVALALSSAILLLGYNTLSGGTRLFNRVSTAEEQAATIFAARRLLREAIEEAHFFKRDRGSKLIVDPFIGRSDSVIFSTPLLDPATDHLSRVMIRFDLTTQALQLVYTQETNDLNDPTIDQSSVGHTIVDSIKSLEFQYLERVSKGQSRWVQSWINQSRLPDAVKISFEFEGPLVAFNQELIVEPKVSGLSNCVFDPVARACRVQ